MEIEPMRKCKFPGCERKARKGWTMCSRHYSAGDSIKSAKRKLAEFRKRQVEEMQADDAKNDALINH